MVIIGRIDRGNAHPRGNAPNVNISYLQILCRPMNRLSGKLTYYLGCVNLIRQDCSERGAAMGQVLIYVVSK